MFVREQASGPRIEHSPGFDNIPPSISVSQVERVLSEWFGAEIVLTSSGRGAVLLYLTACGFDRYRDRIAVPRMISSCVLDAVIRRGFPVDAENARDANATLLYHQYGIPQIDGSECIIEDICHAFFSSPNSGARSWRGGVAVFSLPKFFRVSGMSGGLVMARDSRNRQLRDMRHEAAERSASDMKSLSQLLESPDVNQVAIEKYHLARLLNPQIYDDETGGMPASIHEIEKLGERRRETFLRLSEAVGRDALPSGWHDLLLGALPFALPAFGDPDEMRRLEADLAAIKVVAGIYQIDIARNAAAPRYQRALLLPCHQGISSSKLDEMVDVIKTHRLQCGA